MNRHTFVIQIYSEGISTLENLTTRERVQVSTLTAVAPQIETWLADSQAISPSPYGRGTPTPESREGNRESDA